MARGIGIGQGLNAFAQGAAQGIGLVNMLDERKNLAEDRALARVDRERTIKLQDEQLTNQRAIPVFAESETKFFLKVVDAQVEFFMDANGTVTQVGPRP